MLIIRGFLPFLLKIIQNHAKHAFRSFSRKLQNIWEIKVFSDKTLFFQLFSYFSTKYAKTWKQRVFKQKSSFCMCFAFFPQDLVKHENNVFSSRKVVFCTNLAKTHEKRSILIWNQIQDIISYKTLLKRYVEK